MAAAATKLGCDAGALTVSDGAVLRDGARTAEDYWTLAPLVKLAIDASGAAAPASDFKTVGTSTARRDLPGKIFGEPAFIHDMRLDGRRHARVVRQPNPHATIETIDEAAIRRAAKAPVEFVRTGNFLAIVGEDETAVERAAVAALNAVRWANVEQPAASQQEATWLLQRPMVDIRFGAPEAPASPGTERFEAAYSRGYLAHASISPSCGLALYKDGRLTVWTHSQGVFPLRGALARTRKLAPEQITVQHVQGSGCYGHNGADDAAADAAIVAMQTPNVPIRIRWRREEEFVYEPKTSTKNEKEHTQDKADSKPTDKTTENRNGTHNGRPGSGANLLSAYALPEHPADPPPNDVPEANGGGATRNAEPLYDIPRKRILQHLVTETPVRVSSLRGLGAMPNVFALECAIDELAARAGRDPVDYRLSITSDRRARAVIEKAAAMARWDA